MNYDDRDEFRAAVIAAMTELKSQDDKLYSCREIARVMEIHHPDLSLKNTNEVSVKAGLHLSTMYQTKDPRIVRDRNPDVRGQGGTYLYRLNPATTTV